jgi:hypothetical protein
MSKPLIQVNDEIREMTDEEYERYKLIISESTNELPSDDETPSAD